MKLDVTILLHGTEPISDEPTTIEAGETLTLYGDGDKGKELGIKVEPHSEVEQILFDDQDNCPVCGEDTDEDVKLEDFIGESIDVDRYCVIEEEGGGVAIVTHYD